MVSGFQLHRGFMVLPPADPRPRWADLADNSDEDDQDLLTGAALDDASYREGLASLEDSKSGLNAKLAKSGMGPKDFSFLLEGDAKVTSLEAATPFGARRLDLPRRSSEKPSRRSGSDRTQAASAPSPRKAGPTKKRPPVTLPQAFPQKSNKSDLREAALRSRPGPCSETGSSVQSEGVEATEEEWEHRESMRAKAVAQCKASPEYQRCQRLRTGADSEPLTPNHADRSISKRQWKLLLQRWRYEMQRYLEEHEAPETC